MLGFLIWTLFIILAVWFLLIRPQRRRMMEHQALMAGLGLDHEIVTAGGIYGRIQAMDDELVRVEIAPGTVIRLSRRAIARDLTAERSSQLGESGEPGEAGPEPGPEQA